jgi:hypothetical protein
LAFALAGRIIQIPQFGLDRIELADLGKRRAAAGAVAALGRVDGGQPLQFRRQGATRRLGARRRGRDARGLSGLQLGLHRRDVLGHRLVEQVVLEGIHALGAGRVLQPAQPRQLVRKLADQRIALAQRALVRGRLGFMPLDAGIALKHHAAQRGDVIDGVEWDGFHPTSLAA